MRKLLFSVFFTFFSLIAVRFPSAAETPSGCAVILKSAISLSSAGKYAESLPEFDLLMEKCPVVADYGLFYKAGALDRMKDREHAAAALQQFLKDYPRSPLARKARLRSILLSTDESSLINRLSLYEKEYPGDGDMALKLALLLKEKGLSGQADRILGRLYSKAGRASLEALINMSRPPTVDERIKRAGNLIRRFKYQEAEQELRDLLASDTGGHKDVILNLLGKCLFRQKRYSEAANIYLMATNNYDAARCYYRLNNESAFANTISGVINGGDDRGYSLLVAEAGRKRRGGDYEGALSLLDSAARFYPEGKELVLWERGWLYYMKRDYEKALGAFSRLTTLDDKPEYEYWMAKTIEGLGGNSTGLFEKLSQGDDFYALLSKMNLSARDKTGAGALYVARKAPIVNDIDDYSLNGPFERAGILYEAGLRDEAVRELVYLASHSFDPKIVSGAAMRLKALGSFRRAILAASRLPEEYQPKEVVYPVAFWNSVEKNSVRKGLDPYLVLSVMREESRFEPRVCSPAGALGLMQLMPNTAQVLSKSLKMHFRGTRTLYNADKNITLGVTYLKKLVREFHGIPPALAAYNAGENAVKGWLKSGKYLSYDEFIEDIPYLETKNYVKRIITSYFNYKGEEAAAEGLEPGQERDF